MGYFNDYDAGRRNPYELPGPGPTNFAFQQGQFDEQKRILEGNRLPPPANALNGGSVATGPTYTGQPHPGSPKSMIAAVLLPAMLGPLGLFYGSKKGAIALIVALLAVTMLPGAADNGALMYLLIAASIAVSVVWSVVAVWRYNRNVRRRLREMGL